MAAGDILIRWASESSAAVRDMAKVEGALKDTMSSGEKWSRRWATASDIARLRNRTSSATEQLIYHRVDLEAFTATAVRERVNPASRCGTSPPRPGSHPAR